MTTRRGFLRMLGAAPLALTALPARAVFKHPNLAARYGAPIEMNGVYGQFEEWPIDNIEGFRRAWADENLSRGIAPAPPVMEQLAALARADETVHVRMCGDLPPIDDEGSGP